jgi:hypothetical protein
MIFYVMKLIIERERSSVTWMIDRYDNSPSKVDIREGPRTLLKDSTCERFKLPLWIHPLWTYSTQYCIPLIMYFLFRICLFTCILFNHGKASYSRTRITHAAGKIAIVLRQNYIMQKSIAWICYVERVIHSWSRPF